MNELLPWQQPQWRNVSDRLRAETLPHALLLAGPAGLGKTRFADRLAWTVLCETGAGAAQPCGQCRSCKLLAAGSHPDLRVVMPAEAGKAIVVDQVREANAFLTQTAQYDGYKVSVIRAADRMNVNAANSLLKTLEEPAARSLILLVSDRPGQLPATIVSRCQRLGFTLPAPEVARQWLIERIGGDHDPDLLLGLAEGAPLRASTLQEEGILAVRLEVMRGLEALSRDKEDVCVVAARLVKLGLQPVLYWMYQGVADMVRLRAGGGSAVINHDLAPQLTALAQAAALQAIHGFHRALHRTLNLAERPLNPQLLMENLLMGWQDLFTPPPATHPLSSSSLRAMRPR